MKNSHDTIAAIATPLGEGGLGIVRISGPDAIRIADSIFMMAGKKDLSLQKQASHSIHFGYLNWKTEKIDEVMISIFRAPRSYTTEDTIEISCHGGNAVLLKILEIVLESGSHLAEPGEFTKRAFLNGRIDLAQAEAVVDLIHSRSESQRKVALQHLEGKLSKKIIKIREAILKILASLESSIDFPDEDIPLNDVKKIHDRIQEIISEIEKLLFTAETGRWIKAGIKTLLVGKPNSGKSTLLNALIEEDRAIVTSIPGTTRDVIEEEITLKGLTFRLADTAGLRNPRGKIEIEGVKRTHERIATADLILWLVDGNKPFTDEDHEIYKKIKEKKIILIINKRDLPIRIEIEKLKKLFVFQEILEISALTCQGMNDLRKKMLEMFFDSKSCCEKDVVITNIRHQEILVDSLRMLISIKKSIKKDFSPELISVDVRNALDKLSEIIGLVTTEDVLNEIFEKFCIGK